MATKTNLIGLGVPFKHAQLLGDAVDGAIMVTGAGASIASGYQIGGNQYLVVGNASNSGFAVTLPPVGGDQGCLLGDTFVIGNPGLSANGALTVFGPTGSTIYYNGTTVSGSGGTTVASGHSSTFIPISATSWIGTLG